jgi:hypothetical protein
MQGKVLNLIVNYCELRTYHEPYVVHGMVQGWWVKKIQEGSD